MPRRYAIPLCVLFALYAAFLAGAWLARPPSGMLLVTPATRYAGESIAVDYEAVRGFVVGRPIRR